MNGSESFTYGAAEAAPAFRRLYDIVKRLRGPEGCPWDREQNPASLRGDLIEETYECIEAIDEKEPGHIREELGDLFLLVTMIAYMHEQDGSFSVAEALEGIAEKLIRRHPHVFGPAGAENGKPLSPEKVLENWARIKIEQEGRAPKDSVLDEVPRSFPPLDRAWKLQKKAAKKGFDWPDAAGVFGKLREELAETEEALRAAQNADGADGTREALEGELGDILFSAVNLCRWLGVEPSLALRKTNAAFTARFKHVEKRMRETGLEMNAEHLSIMERFWKEAKSGTP